MSEARARPTAANELTISVGADTFLNGMLQIPARALGLVAFVHGSGSSRFSPRNRFVADYLVANGFATLLMDLLTPEEEAIDDVTRELRFDISLLAQRVVATIDWLHTTDSLLRFPIGLFGASTGAAAALVAASLRPSAIGAVVSRGGRPDLATTHLTDVHAPTLLIVGGDDPQVLKLNRTAFAQLHADKELVVVPHATHLFEEPGALEQVAQRAAAWFQRFLGKQSHPHSISSIR
jgi:putative phosphoribosyl transferase